MRLILALAAAAAVVALGAVILGEYAFAGPTVVGAGAAMGLFAAEGALWVSKRGGAALAGGCAAVAAAGMTWAAWISTGHDLSFLQPEGWGAIALAGAVAGVRAWWSRPRSGSPPREPAPAE